MGQMNMTTTQTHPCTPGRWLSALLALSVMASCGVDAPADPAVDAGSADDTSTAQDSGGTPSDTGAATDVTTDATAPTDVAAVDTTGTDAGPAADTTGADASTTDAGADNDATTDAGGAADAGTPDAGKTLPLPSCAKTCADCTQCADTPMCANGQEFLNDCQAICKLQAYDWPTGVTLVQGKCPWCEKCQTATKPDAPDAFCAKTAGGAYVPVKQECELECTKLATPETCTAGKCPTSGQACTKDWQCSPKSEVIKGSCGKFNLCMQPVAQGGAACPVNAYNPVCSKKDGTTYATECAMQACDLSGCFPLNETVKSAQCDPGKMVAECGGECYDKTKWTTGAAKCPGDCNPVCAVISGKSSGIARTYRNGCIAKGSDAAVLNCEGVSATAKDKCSAELYEAATTGACCPDVDYSIVKQVCASKGTGATATWYTFRNQSEFDCLTVTEKGDWTFQYLGPCVCNCPQTNNPVCGDDGLTYQNACQAQCYNGDKFSWKSGACSP